MAKEITKITALENAIAALQDNAEMAETVGKLEKMLAAEEARRERAKNAPKVPSKEQREREELAREMAAAIDGDVTAPWVVEMGFAPTTTKASGLFRTAIRLGLVEKGPKVKGGKGYIQSYHLVTA